jgi:hypothetical protein
VILEFGPSDASQNANNFTLIAAQRGTSTVMESLCNPAPATS